MKEKDTLIVENEKKNVLSKVLVISWEKHLRTWCTDLVWLWRILLLEDTSIEEQNSSCRKCDRSSWDVKSISYGTYLILAKNKKYAAGEETRPLRDGAHLAKKKFVSSEMWETSHRVKKTTCISLETKKKDIRGKRETRYIYIYISYEKWDISRNVWHFTRNLVVDIEKVRQFQ